jgi:hypothetical protein
MYDTGLLERGAGRRSGREAWWGESAHWHGGMLGSNVPQRSLLTLYRLSEETRLSCSRYALHIELHMEDCSAGTNDSAGP